MPAIIGKPAPAFKGQAVVDGEIKEISIADYKGESSLPGVCVLEAARQRMERGCAPATRCLRVPCVSSAIGGAGRREGFIDGSCVNPVERNEDRVA